MEIKVLIYIVGGIIWFIYNSKNKIKKDSTDNKPSKIDFDDSGKVEPVIIVKSERPETIFKTKIVSVKPSSKAPQIKSENVKNTIFFTNETKKMTEGSSLFKLEMEEKIDYEQNSIGNNIGFDIQNGNLDLRKAVIISELLKPVQ